MGNTKAIFATGATVFTAAVTIVACGSDHAAPDAAIVLIDSPVDMAPPIDAPPDAPSFDFSCSGNSAPTAGSNFTVTGNVQEVALQGTQPSIGPLADAAMTLCTGSCSGGNNLGSASTDASGNFSIGPNATMGSAVDAYVRMTHTGDRTVLAFPSSPFTGDTVQPIITFQDIIIQFGSQFGCDQQAGNGMLGLLISDCANMPITDGSRLTISVQQNGSDVGDPPIDAGGLSQMAAGFYLVCNVPPGTTTVGAKYDNMDLRSHDVETTAGTTTETIVRPGF